MNTDSFKNDVPVTFENPVLIEAVLSYIKLLGEVIDFTTSDPDDFTTQFVNNSFLLNGINDTDFVINDLPSDNDYFFVVEKKFYFMSRCFNECY